MTSPKLTEAVVRAGADQKSYSRGRELYRHNAISNAAIQGNILSGVCEGTESPFYKVRAELDAGGIRSATCNCLYDFGGFCKHIVALLLAYAHAPQQFAVRRDPAELLADLSREQLIALIRKLLGEQPDLSDWVEAAIAAPSASGRRKTGAARSKKVDVEVYRRRVRGIMHSLDRMRMSEAYWHVGGLVEELHGVEKTAREFLDAGDAEAALRILLTLLEESHDGFEYIDDSNGELGDFLSGLGETLAEAILSFDREEEQRRELVSELEDLHRQLSDYGVEGLSVAIIAARYGWGETPPEEQARRDKADDDEADDEEWDDEDDEDDDEDQYEPTWSSEYLTPGEALTRAKLNVLERQGRTDDYLALCLQTGAHLRYALKLIELDRLPEGVSYALEALTDVNEALTLAQSLRESGQLDEAIKIGERGLQLAGHKAALGRWLGALAEAQGRNKQALEAWLAAFHAAPSLAIWQTIKRLAGSGWNKLKPKVMASLEKQYDKRPLAEVLLDEQEWDAAVRVAEKNAQDYRVVAMVADAVTAHRPAWVIDASIKQAEALIAPTKSNLYPAAADWLRRAKAGYAQMGRTGEWQKYLRQLKEQYKRRPSLLAQLAKL